MFSSQKVILAGDVLHHYSYSKPIKYGESTTKPNTTRATVEDLGNDDCKAVDPNAYRCKKAIKLLLEANAGQYQTASNKLISPVFITFTFAERITSLAEGNATFNLFTKRLNYQVQNLRLAGSEARLKYLAVPEFQDKNGRGAVHYHVVYFNLPFVPRIYDFMTSVWGQGFVNVKVVRTLQHLTNYVAKYISKTNRDDRLAGQKKYFCSRGLYKPVVIREERVVALLMAEVSEQPSYTGTYTNYESQLTTVYQCFRFKKPMRQQFLTTQAQAQLTKLKTTYSMALYYFS